MRAVGAELLHADGQMDRETERQTAIRFFFFEILRKRPKRN